MKYAQWCLLLAAASAALTAGAVRAAEQLSSEDPIAEIAGDMGVVVRQLEKLSTGTSTQLRQKAVVAKLDELIAKLDKECAACRGGASGANPTKPAADSIVKGGPGGIGDLHAARQAGKKWGELPAHQRDRILQSMSEGFPPYYQQILERYYRRLAEEKPAAGSGDRQKSNVQPRAQASSVPAQPPAASTPTEAKK